MDLDTYVQGYLLRTISLLERWIRWFGPLGPLLALLYSLGWIWRGTLCCQWGKVVVHGR